MLKNLPKAALMGFDQARTSCYRGQIVTPAAVVAGGDLSRYGSGEDDETSEKRGGQKVVDRK